MDKEKILDEYDAIIAHCLSKINNLFGDKYSIVVNNAQGTSDEVMFGCVNILYIHTSLVQGKLKISRNFNDYKKCKKSVSKSDIGYTLCGNAINLPALFRHLLEEYNKDHDTKHSLSVFSDMYNEYWKR